MENAQYGVWFGVGAVGALALVLIHGLVSGVGGFADTPMFVDLLLWMALGLGVVSLVSLAGFMTVVLEHIRASRSGR